MSIPLAERIRPKKLDDYLSQKHLVGKNGTLKAQLSTNMLSSMIFWGPPGTGKTKWLDDTFGRDGYAIAPDNTGRWFDGCDCDVILFDDVEANAIPPFSKWKQLCDRYPHSVPVKGGFILWKPKTIVFTSNQTPDQW